MGVENPSKPRKTSRNKRSAQVPKQLSSSRPLSPLRELSWFAAIAVCLKLLLIPSYRSTDFEVHRNWLAVTSSLPLPQWYSDRTSPWTLDYPPLFAYFELFLSFFATLVDPTITDLRRGLDYAADSVVYFQRLTVTVADLGLLCGVYLFVKRLELGRRQLVLVLVVLSPALLIVDHIHFQYNGFLIGVLLISLALLEERRDLTGGFVFAVLLCLKHLFAVAAPLYFVYLLRHYCRGGFGRAVGRLLAMAAVVGAVFAVAFGPFVYYGQVAYGMYIGHLPLQAVKQKSIP
ncbi:hypothetical protein ACLOJK_030372 [Asimina triloba]